MITAIIAALLSLGIIAVPDDYHNASDNDKKEMESIVIDDIYIE